MRYSLEHYYSDRQFLMDIFQIGGYSITFYLHELQDDVIFWIFFIYMDSQVFSLKFVTSEMVK